jgi:hypothetical protein
VRWIEIQVPHTVYRMQRSTMSFKENSTMSLKENLTMSLKENALLC